MSVSNFCMIHEIRKGGAEKAFTEHLKKSFVSENQAATCHKSMLKEDVNLATERCGFSVQDQRGLWVSQLKIDLQKSVAQACNCVRRRLGTHNSDVRGALLGSLPREGQNDIQHQS
uniref:Uncharacterized protein n=1 Tax=Micrurus corallinus TaxID=54390 RepID=A0A2D4GST8_MICCO